MPVADTAFAIAVIRRLEHERPAAERLFEDPYAAAFGSGGPEAARGTQRFLELPFFHDAVRLRTRFVDDCVGDSLEGGVDQLVVLGAGFDCRALRMVAITRRGARVYEVDLAAQLEEKRALLAAAGVALPAHVAQVAADFAKPGLMDQLGADLAAHGFRAAAGALFVWEGVVGYLGRAAIAQSLAFMARAGGPGGRVVFDFGKWTFDPETVADRAREAGFSRCQDIGFDELWRRYLPGEPHANAAFARMAVAEV
jgi:methyltransferase (TIGR00027 family)